MATQTIELSTTSNVVVAVNVWPSPLAPVGVNINQQVKGAEFVKEAWIFPFRVGSQTRFLQPDQFGSLENVSARRAAALLLGIPEDQKKQIRMRSTRPVGKGSYSAFEAFEFYAELQVVDPDKNVARFLIGQRQGDGLLPLHVPLDWIESVWWEELTNYWIVSITAVIEKDAGGYKVIMVR
jgi:hypothetical protein